MGDERRQPKHPPFPSLLSLSFSPSLSPFELFGLSILWLLLLLLATCRVVGSVMMRCQVSRVAHASQPFNSPITSHRLLSPPISNSSPCPPNWMPYGELPVSPVRKSQRFGSEKQRSTEKLPREKLSSLRFFEGDISGCSRSGFLEFLIALCMRAEGVGRRIGLITTPHRYPTSSSAKTIDGITRFRSPQAEYLVRLH